MKKRVISAVTAAVLMVISAMPLTATAAVTDINIIFDGSLVDYTLIDDGTGTTEDIPQILGDRAMVPVRKTMTYYGIDLVWSAETRTMTMTFNGIVSTHVLGTNIVIINGVLFSYDKTSEVVEEKTLMPNIMIADIINCDTWWDNETRTVYMQARKEEPAKPLGPEVVNFSQNKTHLPAGEKLILSVTTNNITDRIGIFENNTMVASSDKYTAIGDYRSFIIDTTINANTGQWLQFNIRPGDSSGFLADVAKSLSVYVEAAAVEVTATVNNKPVAGGKANVYIVAPPEITRIRVTNKQTDVQYTSAEPYKLSVSGNHRFAFELPVDTAGKIEFGIEISRGGDYIPVSTTFIVDVAEKPVTASTDKLEIISINWDKTKTYYQYNEVELTVRTSKSAEKVICQDDYTKETKEYKDFTEGSDYREFKFKVTLGLWDNNRFTITAVDSTDRKELKNLIIEMNPNSVIESIKSEAVGSTSYKLTIIVPDSVLYMYITSDSGAYNYSPALTYLSNGKQQAVIDEISSFQVQEINIVVVDKNLGTQTLSNHPINRDYPY